MKISAIYNNYTSNKHSNNNKAKQNTSFGAIKGLGNKADDLLAFITKEVKDVFTKNSSLNMEWDTVYQRYIYAVNNNASENELRGIVKELHNIRVKTELEALDIERRRIAMSNTIELDNLSNPNDQHVVAGFGLGKIAGYDDIKDVLRREFISKIKKERNGEKVDIPSAFFFFGPKGNGKTTSTKAIVEETKCQFKEIDQIFDEDAYNDILNTAKDAEANFEKNGRKIIFIDEFTDLIREGSNIIDQLLDFLKDCSSKFHCTFFGTTNFLSEAGTEIKKLNPVFVSYDPPGKINMMKVLKHYVDGREAGEINYSDLADNLLQWAKNNNGTLGNSHLKTIVSACFCKYKKNDSR